MLRFISTWLFYNWLLFGHSCNADLTSHCTAGQFTSDWLIDGLIDGLIDPLIDPSIPFSGHRKSNDPWGHSNSYLHWGGRHGKNGQHVPAVECMPLVCKWDLDIFAVTRFYMLGQRVVAFEFRLFFAAHNAGDAFVLLSDRRLDRL